MNEQKVEKFEFWSALKKSANIIAVCIGIVGAFYLLEKWTGIVSFIAKSADEGTLDEMALGLLILGVQKLFGFLKHNWFWLIIAWIVFSFINAVDKLSHRLEDLGEKIDEIHEVLRPKMRDFDD